MKGWTEWNLTRWINKYEQKEKLNEKINVYEETNQWVNNI